MYRYGIILGNRRRAVYCDIRSILLNKKSEHGSIQYNIKQET
jgi:hypothetical protein